MVEGRLRVPVNVVGIDMDEKSIAEYIITLSRVVLAFSRCK